MTEFVIVKISTGRTVEDGFDSRSAANQRRWTKYEPGHTNDESYDEKYGVCKREP